MRIFRSLDEIPASMGPTAVSVGNFDGVHRGHRLILEGLQSARERSIEPVVVVFDPHPIRVLRPQLAIKLITPLDFRLELLERAGVGTALVLPFTLELSRMSAAEFAALVLGKRLRAAEVHEGANFRFGHRAEGGMAELTELGRSLGFRVIAHPACQIRGWTVSSSKIRELVSRGEMGAARLLLGRSFSVRSTPAPGRGVGSRLTVPTINLADYAELLPAAGVYVSRLRVGQKAGHEWFDAVTNAGRRPTFDGESFVVESYLFDFRPLDLNPETPLELEFHRRLRDERKWPSPEALKAQIGRDAARATRYHHLRRLLARDGQARCGSSAKG